MISKIKLFSAFVVCAAALLYLVYFVLSLRIDLYSFFAIVAALSYWKCATLINEAKILLRKDEEKKDSKRKLSKELINKALAEM